MIIREANPKDLQDLLILYQQLNPEDDYSNVVSIETAWNQILLDERIHCLLAIEGETVVASCIITIIPNLSRSQRSYGVIENVITHQDYRKNGHGKAIMERAVEIAKEEKCYKVMLMSSSNKKEAHKFYEKIGFDGSSKKGFHLRLS